VYISASVRLDAKVFAQTELEIVSDVENTGDLGIEMLKKENRLYVPIAVKDKSFTLVDELEIPGTKPPASEILRSEAILIPRDSRIVGNKVVFRGDALIKTLYKANTSENGAEIYPVEHELPFSQIIDMEDLEEKCDCRFNLLLSGMDIYITGGSPDSRVFSLTLNIDAQVMAYADREADAIVDIYSTTYELSADTKPCVLTHLIDHVSKTQNTREIIETGEQAGSILSADVIADPVTIQAQPSALVTEAAVTVLYTGGDGQLYSATRRIPVACPLEIPAGATIDASAKFTGEAFAAAAASGIEIRFAMQFDCVMMENDRITAVYGVKVDTAAAKSMAGAPSIVLRKTQEDDTLWNIAKRHNTTMDDLITANGLESVEAVLAGRMLLIPRKR
jgi:hypothetical protein